MRLQQACVGVGEEESWESRWRCDDGMPPERKVNLSLGLLEEDGVGVPEEEVLGMAW